MFAGCRAAHSKKNKLEKFVDKCYSLIEGDTTKPGKKYFFAIPIWGVYPETGWRLGVSVLTLFHVSPDTLTRPSIARLNTQYTQNDQFSIRPYVDIFFRANRYNLKAYYTYTKFAEYYWGVGNTTAQTARELYHFRMQRFNLRGTRQVLQNLYIGPQLFIENMYDLQYTGLSKLESSAVTGNKRSYTTGLGIVCAYDNRDHIYFPLHGAYIEISDLFNNKIFGSDYNYHQLTFDLRKFHRLWNENVLAFQLYSIMNFGNAPFRQLGTIGSDMIMRGYYNGRFRDNNMIALQAEFRKKIWGPLGMVAFGGFGNVGRDADDLFSQAKPNYGIGFRGLVFRKEHVNVRIDYGRGENGIEGFYFTMNEAF